MFETITDADERGQVGIGTLIVFIAMVLVAAIAAGVLINTAGDLQSQASDTGSETQDAVANQIEVVHAVGEVENTTDDEYYVDTLNLTVMKSAGSDVIDLESMTVQYTSSTTDETLTHDGEADNSSFTTHQVFGSNDNSLTNSEDRVALELNVTQIEAGTDVEDDIETPDDGLKGGDSATVRLVDQSGAQFSYGVSVPATIDDYEVVEV